tara:strand:+ start:309 stop:1118 length:810 start_codon:yes stop_codon:yes gene_type:complete
MKTIYYYQTFVGLNKLLTHIEDIDVIIISSLHFGKEDNLPYMHLNNNKTDDKIFDNLWLETHKAAVQNTTIMLMMGGAGGAYNELFSDFKTYYPLLKKLLYDKPWIRGIDLDIEEKVKIQNVQLLINQLISDFGESFIITMAPVASSLMTDGGSMGGFNYKKLYNSKEGKYIKWFNTQCYNSFSVDTYNTIIKNGYPPEKIIMGMESGQFNEKNFNEAIEIVKELNKKYNNFGGVYDWEYLDAPPNKDDPSIWAMLMRTNTLKLKLKKR